uniref:Uncharacterized protein n=1 Tax=Aegilops tauschii subsp. strangulata TaxID=200361 RepID=A0A453T367_AEGTS
MSLYNAVWRDLVKKLQKHIGRTGSTRGSDSRINQCATKIVLHKHKAQDCFT